MKVLFPFLIAISSCYGQIKDSLFVEKNGDGSLGLIYNQTACGLNYVQASRKVTSRHAAGGAGSGLPCVLNISGMPACYQVLQAYVWAVGSYGIGSPPPGASVAMTITNSLGVLSASTFNLIGSHINKCWAESFSGNYRADVTSAISGNGNYTINTAGLLANQIDGMTLLIVYRDLVTGCTYNGRIILYDGMITKNALLSSATNVMTGISPCASPTAGSVKAFGILSDYQLGLLNHNFGISGVGVTSGTGNFADNFYNFDVRTPGITTSTASVTFSTAGNNLGLDCYSMALNGLYYRTTVGGACLTCTHPYTISASNSGPYCEGNTIDLSSSVSPTPICGINYSWTGPNSFSSTISNPSISSSTEVNSGTYSLTTSFPSTCLNNLSTSTDVVVNVCLPIELKDFKASNSSKMKTKLYWETASERDNDFFTIERAYLEKGSSLSWSEVSIVDGAGTTSDEKFYSIIDQSIDSVKLALSDFTVYYRLKQTDFNGKFTYSDIISLKMNGSMDWFVFPNPTNDAISIVNSYKEEVTISIINSLGQVVYPKQTIKKGIFKVEINLPKGFYTILLEKNNVIEMKKFLKQ